MKKTDKRSKKEKTQTELTPEEAAKKKKRRKIIAVIDIVIIVICAAVIGISVYKISSVYVEYHVSKNETNAAKAAAFTTGDDYDFDFDALLEQNSEAVGWIRMKGDAVENGDVDINIDYPVVQTTDNSKYLDVSINGTWNALGTLFVDYRCADGLDSSHALIWGHNMVHPDDAMFGYINKYQDEEDFYEKYPYYDVWIGGTHYIYKVFACGPVDVGGFFFTYSFSDEYSLMDWIEDVYENLQIFDTDISEFDEDSKIISMVACLTPLEEDRRFAVLMYRLEV